MTFANEIIVLMLNLIILGMTVHAKSLYAGWQDARPSRALIMTFASANLSAISAMSFIWVSPVFFDIDQHPVVGDVVLRCVNRPFMAPSVEHWLGTRVCRLDAVHRFGL